jgi:hypothetical protein
MWYVIGCIVAVAIFATGFFVGKKNGAKAQKLIDSVKESVG